MKKDTMTWYKQGLKDGIPIALGYFSVSFTFGIIGVSGGLTWWQVLLISMTNLTSAGQFAGLNIMLSAGTFVEMAVAQLVINCRYSLMSISLSQKVDKKFKGVFRWLLGFGMTDEIFAVAMTHKGVVRRSFFFGLMTIPYWAWAAGTLVGAICGEILPDMVVDALGVAIYGMFIAIVVPKMKEERKVSLAVVLAIVISCALTYVPVFEHVSVGFSVIICAVIASAVGAAFFPIADEEDEEVSP